MKEKSYRSILKALSWRLTGTFDTMVVSYFISGTLRVAITIGFVEVFTKITLYYFHERLWNQIPLGRAPTPPPEYEI